MDVLVTGANGKVGTAIIEHLHDVDRYEFTYLDLEDDNIPEDAATVNVDIRDYDALRPHFDGMDAVVHLALMPGTGGRHSRELGWLEPVKDNLKGHNNVYKAAVEADLDSIIFASSHHAVGMVEVRNRPEIYHDTSYRIDETEPHRPDSPYGLTKTYGEDLGRLANEAHGIRFYALRIGAVLAPEYDHPYGYAEMGVDDGEWERGSDEYEERVARLKAVWQSRRDLAHMVDCCLQDETVEWDQFYGVSNNDTRWLDDLDHAHEMIGYEPQDNGAEWDSPPE
ncbi:MAG: NAD-dependent epimerase/dehydratase family protein [Halobacteriales archaeon]